MRRGFGGALSGLADAFAISNDNVMHLDGFCAAKSDREETWRLCELSPTLIPKVEIPGMHVSTR